MAAEEHRPAGGAGSGGAAGTTDSRAKLGRRVALQPGMVAEEAMLRVHRLLLDAIRGNEEGARRGLDPEPLHDFRVAVRRTRAALSQLRGVLPEEDVARFRADFAWLGRLTGPARDLDVQLLRMRRHRQQLPAELAAEVRPLEQGVLARRQAEYERVRLALDSQRYRLLVADWAEFLERRRPLPAAGSESAPAAGRPIAEVAAERIERSLRRVLKRGRKIEPHSPAAKLHRLRIACKKLRYLLEFFSSLWEPAQVEPVVEVLKHLQDDLGDFNDCEVQRWDLGQAAAGQGESSRTELLLQLDRRQRQARAAFERHFAAFDSPEIQDRLGRLVAGRPV